MPDLLNDFENAISKELNAVESAGSDLFKGHANAAASKISAAFAGPLRGTFVDDNGKIHGPLADVFGSNPLSFAINAVKTKHTPLVDLVNRVAVHRLKKDTAQIKDPQGKTHVVNLRPTTKTSVAEVALALCVEAMARPASVADEVERMALGLPAGRGVDGYIDPAAPRMLFGVDDAIIVGAIVSVLVAIAPMIIGALLSLVGAAVPAIAGALQPKKPPPDPGLFGLPIPIVAAAGVGLVLLLVLGKKKKKGGGGGGGGGPEVGGGGGA